MPRLNEADQLLVWVRGEQVEVWCFLSTKDEDPRLGRQLVGTDVGRKNTLCQRAQGNPRKREQPHRGRGYRGRRPRMGE